MKEYSSKKGLIAGFETMGLVDGPGVRTVVFLQGCPLRCLYCHNPEMQESTSQICQSYTPKQIIEKLKRYKTYYGNNGGVTFSGGEPLFQSDFLLECLKLCKEEGIHTAIDTSGQGKCYEKVLDAVDLVILDIKACDSTEYKKITGGDFERFKEFLKACQSKRKQLWLRTVIVSGINDDSKHMKQLANFIKEIKEVKRVELLPYHDMAKKKYQVLNKPYPLEGCAEMDKEKCKELERQLMLELNKSNREEI